MAKSTLKKNELAAQVAEKLQAWVGPAARLVVGVSGGADSVALLHLLAADKDRRHRLLAVHVNHGLRGAQAQRDEAFVVSLCTRWGVPCKVYAPDVRGAAAGRKWSVEEAGRKLRQECFLLAAREFGAQAVLLAHHRDDQAETVLFNFLRGTGLRGLGGMLPVRVFPHPGAPAGLKLIRPLLEVAKADLTAYCRSQHLTWRHDQSNEDTNFSRNRIRRRLIPWLEKNFNPALRLVLARAAESAARDEAWLESSPNGRCALARRRQPQRALLWHAAGWRLWRNPCAAGCFPKFGTSWAFRISHRRIWPTWSARWSRRELIPGICQGNGACAKGQSTWRFLKLRIKKERPRLPVWITPRFPGSIWRNVRFHPKGENYPKTALIYM